jgi:hypothetical protein
MNSGVIKYLTVNGDYATLEFEPAQDQTEDMRALTDKEVWTKELVSVSGVPEVKVETCYKRVRIPGDGKVNVPYPCAYTRTSKHWLELKVYYPSDIEQTVKDTIINCALEAAIYAAGIVAASVVAPELIPAAIPAAKAAFAASFTKCLSEEISKTVDYEITHESESGEWKRV